MPNYFGKKEGIAIKQWCNPLTTDLERVALHENILYPCFKKLIDNHIYLKGQTQHELAKEWRDECISHLFDKIKKFDPERCPNPFSFFNVCAKHFIIHQINDRKKFSRIVSTNWSHNEMNSGTDENTLPQAIHSEVFTDSSYIHAGEDGDDFLQFLQEEIARTIVNCTDKKEKIFLQHVIQILENNKSMEIVKKRQFYMMMRSMSNLNGREITKYLFRLRKYYTEIKYKYNNGLI